MPHTNVFYSEISLALPSQLAYEAWVTGSTAALKSHKRDEVQLKREEERAKREQCKEQGNSLRNTQLSHKFIFALCIIVFYLAGIKCQ